ncbi:hypothetical protein ESZ50_05670 [Weissella muntiaci]|uniref:Uncharacterized protein n=1 Tax=Weissella muntiaci TaxID=2508881 RepID=A0A6C2C7J2_9LACO|nr:hypothetical protein [Weissella muntiaci]TYC49632.1 hypothetical protein ESZ50_05670 [Weissella muntiaci]
MKVVINDCFGGFGLSKLALKYLGLENEILPFNSDKERTDPKLVECVENLGAKANISYAELIIVEIPDGSHFVISEYDGLETLYYSENEIHEIHGRD